MYYYYFSKRTNEYINHEVHTNECSYLPNHENRVLIGFEFSCHPALTRVRKKYPLKTFHACIWCCRACNSI